MKKVAKLKRLVSKPMQTRYLTAGPQEREAMRSVIDAESESRIDKMSKKGYRLEATVADVFGLFTRGPAQGMVTPVSAGATEVVAS